MHPLQALSDMSVVAESPTEPARAVSLVAELPFQDIIQILSHPLRNHFYAIIIATSRLEPLFAFINPPCALIDDFFR